MDSCREPPKTGLDHRTRQAWESVRAYLMPKHRLLRRGCSLTHALNIWHALKLLQVTDSIVGSRKNVFDCLNINRHENRVRNLLRGFFPPLEGNKSGVHANKLETSWACKPHPITGVDPELLLLAAAEKSHLISAKILVHDYNATGDIPASDSATRTAQTVGVTVETASEAARIFFQRLGRFCGLYELSKRVRLAHCTETSQVLLLTR